MIASALRAVAAAWMAIALLLVAPSTQAAAPGEGVRSRLVVAPVLRGNFEMEKRLQGFRNPLVSKGEFIVSRERGVLWSTKAPFASSLVLTKQGLLRQEVAGQPGASRREASQAVATANALLMALLAGDVDALSRQFQLTETLQADGRWSLRLVPRPGPLQSVFRRIDLEGDQVVRSVRLEEVRGDSSQIRFLDVRTAPAALTKAEARRFD